MADISPSNPIPSTNTKFRVDSFRLDKAGFCTSEWQQVLAEHEAFEWCLNSANYVHVMATRPVKGGDTVRIYVHDLSQFKEYLIRDAGKTGMRLLLIREATVPDVVVPEKSDLDVKWIVGNRKWKVIRKSDQATIQEGFALKEDAVAWIIDHNKRMAA